MKKFRLVSNSFINYVGKLESTETIIKYDSLADLIQNIESNAGWYTADSEAFKVVYIEEVIE